MYVKDIDFFVVVKSNNSVKLVTLNGNDSVRKKKKKSMPNFST